MDHDESEVFRFTIYTVPTVNQPSDDLRKQAQRLIVSRARREGIIADNFAVASSGDAEDISFIEFQARVPVGPDTIRRMEALGRSIEDELRHLGLGIADSRVVIVDDAQGPTNGFSLWIDPGDAPAELVADVLRGISDLHRAAGGAGLRFRVDGETVLAVEEETV